MTTVFVLQNGHDLADVMGSSKSRRSTLEIKQPILFSCMNFEGSMRQAVLYQSRTILPETWEVVENIHITYVPRIR